MTLMNLISNKKSLIVGIFVGALAYYLILVLIHSLQHSEYVYSGTKVKDAIASYISFKLGENPREGVYPYFDYYDRISIAAIITPKTHMFIQLNVVQRENRTIISEISKREFDYYYKLLYEGALTVEE
jgi:hypothetical protein